MKMNQEARRLLATGYVIPLLPDELPLISDEIWLDLARLVRALGVYSPNTYDRDIAVRLYHWSRQHKQKRWKGIE